MNIQDYIQSGIIEAYTLGIATPEEATEFESLLPEHAGLRKALYEFEVQLEASAMQHQVPPPEDVWNKIRATMQPGTIIKKRYQDDHRGKDRSGKEYIKIQAVSSNHIKVHKIWRWILLAIFILGKIFLGFAIYYYIQYRQASMDNRELKQQIEQPR